MIDRWIFDRFRLSLRTLACARIVYAVSALMVMLPTYEHLASIPDSLYNPPLGPFMLFLDGFPPAWFFAGLNAVMIVACWCLVFGYRTPIASLAMGLCLLVGNGFDYSTGKIDHPVLFTLLPLVMAGSGWGWRLSIDAAMRPQRAEEVEADPDRGWAVAMMALVIGFAMFTAGYIKATTGWLDPTYSATYGHLLQNRIAENSDGLLPDKVLELNWAWFWEAGDWVTVVFEMGLLAAVFGLRSMRVFTALGCVFHFGVVAMFGIIFWRNPVVYAIFIDFDGLTRRGRGARVLDAIERTIGRTRPWMVGAVCAGWLAATYAAGTNPLWLALEAVGMRQRTIERGVVYAAAMIGAGYLVYWGAGLIGLRRRAVTIG